MSDNPSDVSARTTTADVGPEAIELPERRDRRRFTLTRAWRLAQCAVLVGLAAWAGRWAYVRVTTRPPGAPPYEEFIAELLPPGDGNAGERITEAMS
jgi:hypothetical protein